MRLKDLSIAGFRGFNAERTMSFSENLVLVSAPNSYGKTSITEALEFLFYGETSKVTHAQAREEYRDSYRNRHFNEGKPAIVEAKCIDDQGREIVFRVELDASNVSRRFVNGVVVATWPFADDLVQSARPFVVQHALKYLLLVAPSERFQGFARLLGLFDVDAMQQAIVNLCTKPEANIPDRARKALSEIKVLEGTLDTKELQSIWKDLLRGPSGIASAYKKVHQRTERLLGKGIAPDALLAEMVAARDKAAARVYSGSIAVQPLSTADQSRLGAARETLQGTIGGSFLSSYARLAARDARERLQKEASLLSLGIELLSDTPERCPLCGQSVALDLGDHLAERHKELVVKLGEGREPLDPRKHVSEELSRVEMTLKTCQEILACQSADLLASMTPESERKVRSLLGKDREASWEIAHSSASAIEALAKELQNASETVGTEMKRCRVALEARTEQLGEAESTVRAIQRVLAATIAWTKKLDELTAVLAGPAHLLRQAIDAMAGTQELGTLIDLVQRRAVLERNLAVRHAVDGLRELKRHVEQTVGEVMEAAFGTDLTGSVMTWYGKIRTKGDPDVHFSGFAMERTKTGDFKSRRVKVAAHSYGVELASAVSSLSESKLNALGLCVSIATAVRAPGPWGFLVLDDPIQSWDEDHETQFIDIIRSLVEQEGKQVILLSHRDDWINRVSLACRSINGARYRVTGYTQDGPHIVSVEWAATDQRLREILKVANDPKAEPVRLQQAEAEIRITTCQLTAEIVKKKLARERSPHSLNKDDVRSLLVEAGCPVELADKVFATFATSDDAHHAPKKYRPSRERLLQLHGTLLTLKHWSAT